MLAGRGPNEDQEATAKRKAKSEDVVDVDVDEKNHSSKKIERADRSVETNFEMPPQSRRLRSTPPDTLPECLARLRSLPRAPYWSPVSDRGHAAVLAVLFDCADDPTPRLLLTRRANLRSHSGEVALPGGRRDPEDELKAAAANAAAVSNGRMGNGGVTAAAPQPPLLSSVDAVTALREAHEETGLEPSALEVVAELPPLLSKHLLSVGVVVAALKRERRPESVESFLESLRPSPSEVDAAFEAPLACFLDPPASSATPARPAAAAGVAAAASKGSTAAAAGESASWCSYSHRDARFGRVRSAPRFRLHFFDMRGRPCVFSDDAATTKKQQATRRDDFLVWGLTAGIAVEVASAALGRPPAFELSPPRAPPYARICCFRDRNGGMPTVMTDAAAEKEDKE